MQFGVNLLPTRKIVAPEEKLFKKLRNAGVVVLVVYVFLISGLIASSFYFSLAQKQIDQQRQKTEAEIKRFEKRETLALTLKERMGTVGDVIGQQEKLETAKLTQSQLLSWLRSFLLPGVIFNDADLSSSKLGFSGEAENGLILGDFLDQFLQTERTFKTLKLETLSRTGKGNYEFSFKGQF